MFYLCAIKVNTHLNNKKMNTYKEVTNDRGVAERSCASDNMATYITTSAYAHDLLNAFIRKYNRMPSSRWYNKHFRFKRVN